MTLPLKASVIIPSYNRAQVLSLCLISLQRQGYPRDQYEIIVVDDGSTDDTSTLLTSARNSSIKVVRTENKGPASARNTGAGLARGEILIFLDSDFITRKSFIGTHLKAHTGENNLLVSGMGHWHYIATFDYKDKVLAKPLKQFFDQLNENRRGSDQSTPNALISEAEVVDEQFDSYLFRPKWLEHWGYESIIQEYGENLTGFQMPWLASCTGNLSISHRDFLSLGRFDENLRCFEDWEFGLRFLKAGGRLRFSQKAEAFQQICPPDPNRKTHEQIHYGDFLTKHPDLEVGLLSILNKFGFSFQNLSDVIAQQSAISNQELKEHMETLVIDHALEKPVSIKKLNASQREKLLQQVMLLDEVRFGSWKRLFLQLATIDASRET